MKQLKEWFMQAPWGKVALISWGNPTGEPVLLVHGRQDSAATFLPLLKLMPDTYHYVGCDLPGHGKSDPFPTGLVLSRLLMVTVIHRIVKHLEWSKFIYIGHSLGAEQGLFFNAVYPGHVTKFIHLDANPPLQRLLIEDFSVFYKYFYGEYYKNYDKYNTDDRVYSKEDAIKAVMRSRKMTHDEAEVILSRNLVPIGEDKYRLSWDKRLKIIAPTDYPIDYYYELFTKNIPPSLFISANNSEGDYYQNSKELVEYLISDMEANYENVSVVRVDGTHDVHFTNPERFIKEVKAFLAKDFNVKSKL